MDYEAVMKLALERGFYFPSCEVYADAQAGFWEYGPSGVSLKNKFLELWRRELVRRDGMIEIDGSQIMSKSVFEASGHLSNFADPIIKCTKCNSTFRADRTIADATQIEIPESADLDEFDKYVGTGNLKILHLNDAKGDIGCNLDRHYHLGLGGIGEKGIAAVVKFANKRKIPIILETPIDDDRDDFENIRKAKEFA